MTTAEWTFAQTKPSDELAHVTFYSMKKQQGDREIEFLITVREYVTPRDPAMVFYADTDKQTNQRKAPFTPCGWGRTLLDALSECVKSVHRFPYEGA